MADLTSGSYYFYVVSRVGRNVFLYRCFFCFVYYIGLIVFCWSDLFTIAGRVFIRGLFTVVYNIFVHSMVS